MNIAAIDYWANSGQSRLHGASALGKGLAAAAFVVAIVLATSPYLLAAIYLILVAGVFASRLPARRLFVTAAYPTVFALLFAASRWNGDWLVPAVILLKTLAAAQVMVLLITTTPYPDLFAAVGRVLPGLVADGLFVTYRSFFLLLREMDRMMIALRLRGGLTPRHLVSNLGNSSRALGMLLVRAVDLSEKLYAVLRVRGYQGRLVVGNRWRVLSANDVMPLAGGVIALGLALFATLRPAQWSSMNGLALMGTAVLAGAVLFGRETRRPARRPGEGERSEPCTQNSEPSRHPVLSPQPSLLSPEPLEEVVRVGCVRHVYPDGTEVSLCGLDFVALQGERVVILGPNGAGKSTLLNHLLGLLRPTEGDVRVLGRDPAREFSAIQPRLGVLLQNVDEQLLGPTVADDVAFGARNAGYGEERSRAMAHKAMAQLGVLHLADKVPHYLSGGEKRKVALAGALVTDPDLLVLDEPFEGLDPRSRSELVALLADLHEARKMTIIVTTHHVDLLPDLADKVYVLADGGRIVGRGTPHEVFSQPELLKGSAIEPPVLTVLFQRLLAGGLDLGVPLDVDDAAQRLLALAKGSRV